MSDMFDFGSMYLLNFKKLCGLVIRDNEANIYESAYNFFYKIDVKLKIKMPTS